MSSVYSSFSPVSDSSPGFSFGRSGACSEGTYLQVDSVPSNLAGRIVPFSTASLASIFIVCQNDSTVSIEVQKRVGNTFTTIYTASLSAQRIFTETNIVDIDLLQGDELCVKIGSGNTSNVNVGLIIRGSPL